MRLRVVRKLSGTGQEEAVQLAACPTRNTGNHFSTSRHERCQVCTYARMENVFVASRYFRPGILRRLSQNQNPYIVARFT